LYVRSGLGSDLCPTRTTVHSPSVYKKSEPAATARYGSGGYMTKHVPLYNGDRGADTTQVNSGVVPSADLVLPRHSSKKEVSYSGYMLKHTGLSNKWESRWFVLQGGILKYFYEAPGRGTQGRGINSQPKAVISMSSYTVHEGDDDLQRRNCIILKPIFPYDNEYRFALETAFQKRTWMAKLSSGSHKGRIKCGIVGPAGVGKTALADCFFHDRMHEVELKGSNPSLGSHVGYIPAPTTGTKGIVPSVMANGELIPEHERTMLTLEYIENPGRGDWDHVRRMAFAGLDVVMAVFSVDDVESITEVESMVKGEVMKAAPGVPIILVGTKVDLRDKRLMEPSVGHSQAGTRGHLTPMNRQDFHCVGCPEGNEAAKRMRGFGANVEEYVEASAFDATSVTHAFHRAAHLGLVFRTPLERSHGLGHNGEIKDMSKRAYEMYSDERSPFKEDYSAEPRRSEDRVLELPIAAQLSGDDNSTW